MDDVIDNIIHRGIILTYITEYEYDTLEPLYPLQPSGYMEQIYEIENKKTDLMKKILIDSTKKKLCGRRKTKKNTKINYVFVLL